MQVTWDALEPPLALGFRDAARVARRGARRLVLALVLPVLGGLVIAKATYSNQVAHTATVILSLPPKQAFGRNVTDFLRRNMSDVTKQKATYSSAVAYVNTVIFSDQRLLEMMRRRPEFDEFLRLGERKALEKLRGVILATQYSGSYIGESTEEVEDAGGSLIKIECSNSSYAKVVLDVCLELAANVLTFDSQERLDALSRGLGKEDFALSRVRTDLIQAQQELIEKTAALATLQMGTSGDSLPPRTEEEARLYLDIQRLTTDVKDRTTELIAYETKTHQHQADTAIQYYAAQNNAASQDWALLLVDAGRTGPPRLLRVLLACAFAGFFPFMFLLPFSFIMVGTFDGTIYDMNDVRQMKMNALGEIDLGIARPRRFPWLPWRRRHG